MTTCLMVGLPKPGIDFFVCLWKRDPGLDAIQGGFWAAIVIRRAFRRHNPPSGGHAVHRTGRIVCTLPTLIQARTAAMSGRLFLVCCG